jgi:hypothetical protein
MREHFTTSLEDVEEALVSIEAWVGAVRICVRALAEEFPRAQVTLPFDVHFAPRVDYGAKGGPTACMLTAEE